MTATDRRQPTLGYEAQEPGAVAPQKSERAPPGELPRARVSWRRTRPLSRRDVVRAAVAIPPPTRRPRPVTRRLRIEVTPRRHDVMTRSSKQPRLLEWHGSRWEREASARILTGALVSILQRVVVRPHHHRRGRLGQRNPQRRAIREIQGQLG